MQESLTHFEHSGEATLPQEKRRFRPSLVLPTGVYLASDALAFAITVLLAMTWIDGSPQGSVIPADQPTSVYLLGWTAVGFATAVAIGFGGLYAPSFVDTPSRLMMRGLGIISFVAMGSIAAIALVHPEGIEHAALAWLLLVPLFTLGRFISTLAVRLLYSFGIGTRTVLIVGHGLGAAYAKHKLETSGPRHRLAGWIELNLEDGDDTTSARLAELQAALKDPQQSEVLIAAPSTQLAALEDAVRPFIPHRVTVRLALYPLLEQSRGQSLDLLAGDLLTMRVQTDALDRRGAALKRAMDLTLGLTALVAAAPLMLLIAVAIKLDSQGPVLFRQSRVGRNGRTFTMYKFRSMRPDAEAMQAEIEQLNEAQGPLFKVKSDPRVTRVGRIIRKLSLDELPQFLNVLEGNMSLVGPRPALPAEVAQYEDWQLRRLSVLPGITGQWQVNRKNCSSFEEMVWQDLEYVDNWSLGLDVRIALKTIPAIVTTRGAY